MSVTLPTTLVTSHPSWVRGLKSAVSIDAIAHVSVAPFVGAWIEIFEQLTGGLSKQVAPFVGAWIEIRIQVKMFTLKFRSHPSWVRGLK